MKKAWIVLVPVLLVVGGLAGFVFFRSPYFQTIRVGRHQKVLAFIRNPLEHQDWVLDAGQVCGEAPFPFPTRGFVGYLWGDSFRLNNRHQGIDIFAGTDVGKTPVMAAYDGFLTRQSDWKSSLIIRVPIDPLVPEQQIWLYYTHLADSEGNSLISSDFPSGTLDVPVKAGEILGYQGNYSGTPGNPVGVHLHFSIVRDNGNGGYLNELEIDNTIDPSPYLGMELNINTAGNKVPLCLSPFTLN
jgi:murein DD-endopeptidase MepM/ murein hydrolase activator NlpD